MFPEPVQLWASWERYHADAEFVEHHQPDVPV